MPESTIQKSERSARRFIERKTRKTRSDFALLVAFVLVFVIALIFVVGPQVAIVYAEVSQLR